MEDIPYKITVFIFSTTEENNYYIIPYDTRRLGKRIRDKICSHPRSKSEAPIEVVLENKNFTISLRDSEYLYTVWRSGYQVIPCLINHPDLQTRFPGCKFETCLSLSTLNQLIIGHGVLPGGLVGGSCRLRHVPRLSGFGGIDVVSETNLEQACVDLGKFMATTSKTSMWKQGHTYLLENRRKILYLGDIDKLWSNLRWRYFDACGGFDILTNPLDRWNTMSYTTKPYRVVVDITDENSYQSKLLDPKSSLRCDNPGDYILSILKDWWSSIVLRKGTSYWESRIPVKVIATNRKYAYDLGESVFSIIMPDLSIKDLLSDFCKENLPQSLEETIYPHHFYLIAGLVDKDVKEDTDFGKVIYKMAEMEINERLNDFKSGYYYGVNLSRSSSPDKVLIDLESREPLRFPEGMIDFGKDRKLEIIKKYLKTIPV